MVNGLSFQNTNNIGFNPFMFNQFMFNSFLPKAQGDINVPFSGFDFSKMFNGDFMSTFMLFNAFMENQFSAPFSDKVFTKNYNTNNKLECLSKAYNPKLANSLANIAEKNAITVPSDGRHCARGVRQSLEKTGLANGFGVASAYQADSQLRNNKNFQEVNVPRQQLKELPAGCVVVWEQSAGHEHGHIAVTLGDGKEASDKVRNLIVRDTGYSVFVPVGPNKLDAKS